MFARRQIGTYINVHCSPFAENYKNIFEAYGSLHCLCKEIYPLPIYPSDGYGPKPYCPNVHQRFGIPGSHHQNFIAFDPHMFILDVPQSISKSLYLSNHSYHLVMTNSSPWKITIFKFGKPSISMGHLYHGYVSHNQRVVIIHKIPILAAPQPVFHGELSMLLAEKFRKFPGSSFPEFPKAIIWLWLTACHGKSVYSWENHL